MFKVQVKVGKEWFTLGVYPRCEPFRPSALWQPEETDNAAYAEYKAKETYSPEREVRILEVNS